MRTPAATERDLADLESALDTLDAPPARSHTSRRRRVLRVALPPAVAVAVFVGVWQLAVTAGWKAAYVIPAPLTVWHTFTDELAAGHVTAAIGNSLRRAAEGYALSVLIGTMLGITLARVAVLRLALGSILSALQSLPSVAWVPFSIVLFGLDERTMLFVVVMGALPSIANGTLAAVDGIPPLLLRVGDVLGARRLARYRHIVLPAAMPGYVAALKQAWSFSWRSLMAAEIISSGPELGLGLGQVLDNGGQLFDMSLVITAILLILLVGVVVEVCVFGPLDRSVRRRRGLLAT